MSAGGITLRRNVSLSLVVACIAWLVSAATPAHALFTPNGVEWRPLTFPVQEHVTYTDDFGGPRNHPGNDLMGAKLDHELAANDGTITFARSDSSGHSGNMLILTGTDGWKYWYIHINNDDPGTDDGANPAQWRFAPGIGVGVHVHAGQFIAYMGDSGEAETTAPHLHFELHHPDDTYIDPYTSLRIAQGAGVNGQCGAPSNPTPHPSTAAGHGFWTLSADGTVLGFGNAVVYGHPARPTSLSNPYVALAPTPTNAGYWVVDARGNVSPFGNAHQYGGAGGLGLNAPIIGIAPTITGNGYWLLGRDGGIFTYGDAKFYGSEGGVRLNAPVVGLAPTLTGHGYWLLGSDGGIFTHGDAKFYGSEGGVRLNQPVDAMTPSASGHGYWLLARDGGIFTFGDTKFRGSLPGYGWCPGANAIAIAHTKTNGGYWIMIADGEVFAFGDANPYGAPSASGHSAVVLVAVK
jgi:hypothetical protein